jgi:starch-binding outer membrane protein, SusD/RagB family
MKKQILSRITAMVLVFILSSCFDLSETVYSELPVNTFFKTEKDIIAYAGRAYVKLQPYPEEQRLWSLGELAADELVIPRKFNGEWYDQGRWDDIHKHKTAPTNKILTQAWDMVFEGISACNEILLVISPLEFENKERILAEIRILRAFYYYWAMDYWGNIPFSITYGSKEQPPQKDRAFIYDFIMQEIDDNIDALQKLPTPEYYGRVTKPMAYLLRAKMYLNAQEWIRQSKYTEAVAACDEIIALNAYQIENNYFDNFKVNNEGSKENIFVIPYHSQLTTEHFYWAYLTLNSASRASINMTGVPWDGFMLNPTFFTKFAEEDLRRNSFLFGQQYDVDGDPIVIDGDPFIYTPTIADYNSRGEWEGARCAKYEYQELLDFDITDMENDFVLFRYADVLYTKLEALHRLGQAASFLGDPDLQKIRTRAGLTPYTITDLTDDELLDELGREFVWEGHRRQDQIRFGVWEDAGWNKPATDPKTRLFPIPQSALNTNPNLDQNPLPL